MPELTKATGVEKLSERLTGQALRRALRLAIMAEHDAVALYESFAEAASEAKMRQLFQSVADEEKVHIGEFTEALQRMDPEDAKLVDKGRGEAEKLLETEAQSE